MHRDYQSNMPTRFYSFNDRIEIMNPGGLYGKARPENFPFVNDYRNPIVAEGMKVMGFVNMFNHGVQNVKDLLKTNKNPEPRFNVDKITVFEVVTPIAGPEDAYEKTISTSKVGNKMGNKVGNKKLTPTQEKILESIRKNPHVTQSELRESIGLGKTSIENTIAFLKGNGYIKRVGARKNGYWEIL